jgi:hypothetical protein
VASLWAGEPHCLRKPVLWYDAVSTAADMEAFDQHAALDALMDEVGLVEPARYDRQAAVIGQTAGINRSR